MRSARPWGSSPGRTPRHALLVKNIRGVQLLSLFSTWKSDRRESNSRMLSLLLLRSQRARPPLPSPARPSLAAPLPPQPSPQVALRLRMCCRRYSQGTRNCVTIVGRDSVSGVFDQAIPPPSAPRPTLLRRLLCRQINANTPSFSFASSAASERTGPLLYSMSHTTWYLV